MKLASRAVLIRFMDARGFSVRSLAEKVGCSAATIGHLRSGKRCTTNPAFAQLIAEALDCPLDVLFTPTAFHVPRNRNGYSTSSKPVAA